MTTAVLDARPPTAVIRVLNPVMRTILRTPLGRLVRPFVLLEFTGRRSGRRYRVPAGWHEVDGLVVILSPAPWRANFAGGLPVAVHRRGRVQPMTGTLVADPDSVAHTLRSLLDAGTAPRELGLKISPGHQVTAADVAAVDRAIIELRPAG